MYFEVSRVGDSITINPKPELEPTQGAKLLRIEILETISWLASLEINTEEVLNDIESIARKAFEEEDIDSARNAHERLLANLQKLFPAKSFYVWRDPDDDDLTFRMASASPVISDEIMALKTDMELTEHVVAMSTNSNFADAAKRFRGEILPLAKIAFETGHLKIAENAMMSLRSRFARQYGAVILEDYIREVMKIAGATVAGSLLGLLLLGAIFGSDGDSIFAAYNTSATGDIARVLLLLILGNAIGILISTVYNARSLTARALEKLIFEELRAVSASSMKPILRFIFVLAISIALALFLSINIVNFDIADIDFNVVNVDPKITVMIGLFSGLSEVAITNLVAGITPNAGSKSTDS